MHDAISEQFGVAEDLPCADSKFLVPLKRSREFRELRPRLAGSAPHPVVDSWLDDGFHFFVFQLDPEKASGSPESVALAVFAMHPEQVEPISAVTVIPTDEGQHAEITDLREPGGSYIAPIHREHADHNGQS